MGMTLGELLARFDEQSSYNAKVIFTVNGDYNSGSRVREYSDEQLEKEVESWSVEFEEFDSIDLGYEAMINVRVWTK